MSKNLFNTAFYLRSGLIRLELLLAILFGQLFSFVFDIMGTVRYSYTALNLICLVILLVFFASFYLKFIRNSLKIISNALYTTGVLFGVYVAYQNNFNRDSFYVFILAYGLLIFLLTSKKIFFWVNGIILSFLLVALAIAQFEVETPLIFIVFSMGVISIAGFSLASARTTHRRRIKEREHLLNLIFNQTQDGLLLVGRRNNKIVEVNDTAIKIFGYKKRENVIGRKLEDITLDNFMFDQIHVDEKKSIELQDNRIIIIENKKFDYKSDKYILFSLKEYKDRNDLNTSVEFETLKSYSEESYESLFDNSSSYICIINKEGKIIDTNKAVSLLMGYSKEELIGRRYSSFDADDYEQSRKDINELAWKGNTQQFEKTIISNGGKRIEIEILLKRGKYFGEDVLISNFRDITQKKKLEEKALYNFNMYKTLFKESPISIVVADLDGKIMEVNQAFEKLLGFTKKELLTLKIEDISFPEEMVINNKLREKLIKGEIKAIEMGKSYKTKEGGKVYCLLKSILQKDSNGKPHSMLGQIVDITEIEKAERKLKESEKSYKDVFNNTYELLYIINKEGRVIDVNETVIQKYGYTKEEMLNDPSIFYGVVEKNNIEEITKKMEKAWEGEEVKVLWWSKTKDQTIFPKLLQIRNGVYFGQEVLMFSGRDISEQLSYENKLEKSRKKYKDLIDSSIVGVIIFKDDDVVFANKKVAEILKAPNELELLKKSRKEFVKDIGLPLEDDHINDLNAGHDLKREEFSLLDLQGNKIEVEIKTKMVDFEGDKCIMISVIDISDRKKAEEAKKKIEKAKTTNLNLKYQLEQNRLIQLELINSKAYTEGIIESSLDMIFTTNKEGEIIRLNPAAKKELQIEDEDQYKNKPFDLFFESKKEAKRILKLLSDNQPFSGEVKMLRKNGTTFTSFLSINNLISTSNQFVGIMGISRDISEIKAQENEIKKQALKLNAIIETSSHFFFTISKDFTITSLNSLYVQDVKSKYDKEIKVGDNFFKVFYDDGLLDKSEERRAFWVNKFDKIFQGNRERFEIKRKDKKDRIFYREIYLNPIYSKNGEIKEVSCIAHDSTKQREAEQELQNSLEEKNVLLQEVHHRVKNNMQVISSILSLQSTYVKDEETVNILKESQSRIRAMAAIHEKLYRTKNFSDIKFSSYVQNLAENIINTYELSNKTVQLSCKLDEVFLTLDTAIPCGLIINELISNALKYAFEGRDFGKISIELKNEKNRKTLKISDDGIGLPEGIDFKNTESLGLQLVNTLIEQIEGSLEVETNKGTSYKVVFHQH